MNIQNIVELIGAIAAAAATITPLVLALRGNTEATKASTEAAVAHTAAITNHAVVVAQAVAAGVATVAAAVEPSTEAPASTSLS